MRKMRRMRVNEQRKRRRMSKGINVNELTIDDVIMRIITMN